MNAKKEFLDFVGNRNVVCATVATTEDVWDENFGHEGELIRSYLLRKGYSHKDFITFVDNLDFEYYDGYGGQELFGTIWFTDGTWATRGEYDGSEWWKHHELPDIDEELLTEDGIYFEIREEVYG